jgi:hypothetical protein
MKTIRLFSFPNLHPEYSMLRVSYLPDTKEYTVRYYDTNKVYLPDLTYYTTDRMDALDTAQSIFNQEVLKQTVVEPQKVFVVSCRTARTSKVFSSRLSIERWLNENYNECLILNKECTAILHEGDCWARVYHLEIQGE